MTKNKDGPGGQKNLMQHLRQAEKRGLPARESVCVIMFMDIVGYSTFASRSTDSQALALVRRFENAARSEIMATDGRVVMTAGDAIMACWKGRKNLSRAARCARRIKERLDTENQNVPRSERIRIRVGINCGKVLELQDGDIIGNAVNLSCRLQTAAKTGEILLSAEAAEMGAGDRDMPLSSRVGFMRLKGFDQPIDVFALSGKKAMKWLKPITDSLGLPFRVQNWSWGAWSFMVIGLLLGLGMAMTSPSAEFPHPRLTAFGLVLLFWGWAMLWAAYNPRTISMLHPLFRLLTMMIWGGAVVLAGGFCGCWPG